MLPFASHTHKTFFMLPTPTKWNQTTLIYEKQVNIQRDIETQLNVKVEHVSVQRKCITVERISLQNKHAKQRSVSHSKVNMQNGGACLTPK